MCYLIENMSNHTSNDWITVTFKKNEDVDIKFVQVTMTSKHDYLGVTHSFWGDFMPYRFIVYFGDILIPKITAVETIKKPLVCQTSDSEYVSEQECLVNHFLSDNFSNNSILLVCNILNTPMYKKNDNDWYTLFAAELLILATILRNEIRNHKF